MSNSSMILIGVGTSGCRMAHTVLAGFGADIRHALCDTDAATAQLGGNFVLLGGNRLSGLGAGGEIVKARMAVEESVSVLDTSLEGVRLAVLVACLGGGTGGGATYEILRHLRELGIPTIVFATTPFTFEGEDRQRNSRGIMDMIGDTANASFFLPLDKLVTGTDNMAAAMQEAVTTIASGLTFFWRLVDKPGYLRLDAERLRHVLSHAGRGRFAAITVSGENRADAAVDLITRQPILAAASGAVHAILCGILAGEDLRLSEVGQIATGVRRAFGEQCMFELATVNDETTYGGHLAVVVMLFEATEEENHNSVAGTTQPKVRKAQSVLAPGARRDRFGGERTIWHGEDLDEPTYLRKCISLDF